MDPRDGSAAPEDGVQGSDGQRALCALDFLVGRWEGQGHVHGDPTRGRLVVERVTGGGFVLARDQLLEDGRVDHEDLAIYRWDAPNQCLRVHHYSPPGVLADHYVVMDETRVGIRWVSGPLSPRIDFWMDHAELCVEVFLPGENQATQQMRYTRVPSGTSESEPSEEEEG